MSICGHLCMPRAQSTAQHSEMWQSLGWGHGHFPKASPEVSVLSPEDQHEKRGGFCRRAAEAAEPAREGGTGTFPGPRLTSAGRRNHHSPGCAPKHPQSLPHTRGIVPSGLSQCHQSWGHLWGPGIPARCPRGWLRMGHRRCWAGFCSPSLWYIQDSSWECPPLFPAVLDIRRVQEMGMLQAGKVCRALRSTGDEAPGQEQIQKSQTPPNPHHLLQRETAGRDWLNLCITGRV